MNAFFIFAALLGLAMALGGFYLSVRLDLPLGPTDVTLGCIFIFVTYFVQWLLRKIRP
jgi:ABC-type Mn2+/Zn2+ transport system permease subunit